MMNWCEVKIEENLILLWNRLSGFYRTFCYSRILLLR